MEKEYVNSGALFSNRVKLKPNQPDYRGEVLIDLDAIGVEGRKFKLSLAGWKRTSSNGNTFLSLAASKHEPREVKPTPKADEAFDQDQDIPF